MRSQDPHRQDKQQRRSRRHCKARRPVQKPPLHIPREGYKQRMRARLSESSFVIDDSKGTVDFVTGNLDEILITLMTKEFVVVVKLPPPVGINGFRTTSRTLSGPAHKQQVQRRRLSGNLRALSTDKHIHTHVLKKRQPPSLKSTVTKKTLCIMNIRSYVAHSESKGENH